MAEAAKDLQRFGLLQAAQVGSVLLEKGSSSQEGFGFAANCGFWECSRAVCALFLEH